MGIIISIVNNKGGCGKTTTACNLADALGRAGRNVLVVDMDSQCNTTSILFPDESRIYKSAYNILSPGPAVFEIGECVYPAKCGNVSIIPNISETVSLESGLIPYSPEGLFKLRKTLREFALENFDISIIDNPPNMGAFVKNSLNASDFVVVPIRAGSTFSIEGIINATALIREIKEHGNPDLRFLRLLINGVDKRTAICRAVREQIGRAFDREQVFDTEIPINTGFEMAESRRETVFQYDKNAAGAVAFGRLARELNSLRVY